MYGDTIRGNGKITDTYAGITPIRFEGIISASAPADLSTP
jgi:hypothetical protein